MARKTPVSDSFEQEWLVGAWKILPLKKADGAITARPFQKGKEIPLANQGDLVGLKDADLRRFFYPVLKMGGGEFRCDPGRPHRAASYFEEA
jgi:hypothetical protein